MSDMRDKIAEILEQVTRQGFVDFDLTTDAIIAALPSMVVPLVWFGSDDDEYQHATSALGVYEVGAEYTGYGVSFDAHQDMLSPANVSNYHENDLISDARDKAEAHHASASIMAAFGKEQTNAR